MAPKNTIIEAYMEFLSEEFNIMPVKTVNGYVVVERSCSICRFRGTDKTKECGAPLSIGCWQFKFKQDEGNHENISDR